MTRKRDMDLIRSLMLEMEEGKSLYDLDFFGSEEAKLEGGRIAMHLKLIEEAGYAEFTAYLDGSWHVRRITGKGYDFLDSVRDPAIWAKTKDGAAKAGGFTLDLMGALAKGFIKKQIQDRTGIEVDL